VIALGFWVAVKVMGIARLHQITLARLHEIIHHKTKLLNLIQSLNQMNSHFDITVLIDIFA
jgi:hypothetical protein